MKRIIPYLFIGILLFMTVSCKSKKPDIIGAESSESSSADSESVYSSPENWDSEPEISFSSVARSSALSSKTVSVISQSRMEIQNEYLTPYLAAKTQTQKAKTYAAVQKNEVKLGSVTLYSASASMTSATDAQGKKTALFSQSASTKDTSGNTIGTSEEDKYYDGSKTRVRTSHLSDVQTVNEMFNDIEFFSFSLQDIKAADAADAGTKKIYTFTLNPPSTVSLAGSLLWGEFGISVGSVSKFTVTAEVDVSGNLVSQYVSASFTTTDGASASASQRIEYTQIGASLSIHKPDWVDASLETSSVPSATVSSTGSGSQNSSGNSSSAVVAGG